jgi:hypothetical protein
MALHVNITPADNHVAQSLVYPDASARLTATGFLSTDVGRIAQQQSDNSFWILTSCSPVSWALLSTPTIAASVKSGIIVPGSFSGTPKKATVIFGTPYPDTNYSVTLSVLGDGTKTFALDYENKTNSGFTVSLNSNNPANFIEIDWHTITLGT